MSRCQILKARLKIGRRLAAFDCHPRLFPCQFLEDWAIPRLREPAKLAWSLFILSALQHDTAVLQVEMEPPTAEQYLVDAVSAGTFQFLRDLVTSNRRERGMEDEDEMKEASEDILVKLASQADTANIDFILSQLQNLIDSIARKKHFLRNLRNREEDVAIRRSQSTPPAANYQAFLSLVAAVYRNLPADSAQHLWTNTTFTGTILDSRGVWPGPAFWEMLSAISSGPSCASKAYEKIKDTRFQWNSLFNFYQHYYDIMPHLHEPIKTSRTKSHDPMSVEDAEICRGWTNVLTTVVRWSPLARSALLQAKPNPLQMLFDFINCDIPLDLKTSILDAVTAFCLRTGDTADDEILSKAVDAYERISFAGASSDAGSREVPRAPIGWIAKMEYSEQDVHTYPLTRAYIRFLTALLPSPAPPHLSAPPSSQPRLTSAARRGTLYILDRVLLVPHARRYDRDSERWEILADVTGFLERALLGFNMGDLLTQINSRSIGQIANSLAEEAGFTVLLRLLSEPTIFAILAEVVDQSAGLRVRSSPITDVLLRVLRIYYRVFDIQLVFSDVLLLTLSDPSRNSATAFRRPLGLQSLDQHLLVRLSNVNTIALLVGDSDLAISLTSTKIMAALAASPIFSRSDIFRGEYTTSVNRLAGIIDASDDSIRIAQGFCARLDGDGEDLSQDEVTAVEDAVLQGDIDVHALEALPLVVRSAILDLLIENTVPEASSPNLAHFLLGFEFKGSDFGLQDSRSPNARLSCLQVLLDQLGDGATLRGSSHISLLSLHPSLAAKSSRLIYQLFSHHSTARVAMSYTMSVAGLSARQLASLPRVCPPAISEATSGLGVVVMRDTSVITSINTLLAFLDYQRWILLLVALETFAFDGHGASALLITDTLFSESIEHEDVDEDEPRGQRPPLINDLLSSIDVRWSENIPEGDVTDRPLDFFGTFNFDLHKRPDADWWDLVSLGRDLRAYQRQLERQGLVDATNSAKAMQAEAEYILNRLERKNRDTDVSIAKGTFLTAWSEALKVSLAMLFQHVSEERQEIILFELLDELLDRCVGDQPRGVLEILCEAVLVVMMSLVNVLAEFGGVNLPVERLTFILRKVVDAIVRPSSTENARGNLYAAITQHLQLLNVSSSISDDVSVTASTNGRESVMRSGSLGLHRAIFQVLEAKKDRFLQVLCRDAMDDRDVWKTECFTLLGGIVSICQSDRDRQLLHLLVKEGVLSLFVRGIKDQEMAIQDCLSLESGQFGFR